MIEEQPWGQRTQFACLINKDSDFLEELKLFSLVAPYQPAIANLFDHKKR